VLIINKRRFKFPRGRRRRRREEEQEEEEEMPRGIRAIPRYWQRDAARKRAGRSYRLSTALISRSYGPTAEPLKGPRGTSLLVPDRRQTIKADLHAPTSRVKGLRVTGPRRPASLPLSRLFSRGSRVSDNANRGALSSSKNLPATAPRAFFEGAPPPVQRGGLSRAADRTSSRLASRVSRLAISRGNASRGHLA